MRKRMSEADRDAIDLVLDRGVAAADQKGDAALATSGKASPKHISAAQKLLSLLQLLPETQPPADLAAQTMERIRRTQRNQPVLDAGSESGELRDML